LRLDDAARQKVAPAAVAGLLARLHVSGLAGRQHLLDGGLDDRKVVGMDQRLQLVDRHAFGTRRHAEHLVRDVADVQAAGAQVAPPARDLAEVERELEMRVDPAQRARRLVCLGVVHHHADRAVGHAARAVLHLPLRVDPARPAVGMDDAVALRVAADASRRVGIDRGRAVFRMDALDRLAVVRRSFGRVDAPEVEHMLVPATFAGRGGGLPDAEPAEFLGGVEQFLLARRGSRRACSGDVVSVKGRTRRGVECASTQNAPRGPRSSIVPWSAPAS
jgi:hypothetical protein